LDDEPDGEWEDDPDDESDDDEPDDDRGWEYVTVSTGRFEALESLGV